MELIPRESSGLTRASCSLSSAEGSPEGSGPIPMQPRHGTVAHLALTTFLVEDLRAIPTPRHHSTLAAEGSALDLGGARHHHPRTYSREIPGKGLRNRWANSSRLPSGKSWRRGNPLNLNRFVPAEGLDFWRPPKTPIPPKR